MSMRFIMSMLVIATVTWPSSGAKQKKVMDTFASVDESEWFNPLENKDKVDAFIETWGGQGIEKDERDEKMQGIISIINGRHTPQPSRHMTVFISSRHTAIPCFRLVRRQPCSSTLLGAAGHLRSCTGHTA